MIAYTSNKDYEIQIVKDILDDNGIESITINKQDMAYLFGDIELYVHRDNIITAKRIIETNKL